jgi:hypothetical protein
MSENRETTSADRYQASRMWRGYRLRQGRRNQIFFTKHFHKVKMFCEEDKNAPCCRRRFCRSPGETSGLMNHRVTRLKDRRYAVVDLAGDSAAGEAEETIFFHKKFAHSANFL